jgi:hypothetical protein
MPRKKVIATSSLAMLSGIFGFIGAMGWCCTLTGAAILSFLGLASLSSWLYYNNEWLLLVSAIFTILAIYYYLRYKSRSNCPTNKTELKK